MIQGVVGSVVSSAAGSLQDAAHKLEALCAAHRRVAVTGRPGIGKSAVLDKAKGPLPPIFRTDVLKRVTWEAQVVETLEWARKHETWVMEGVTVARALRRGLEADAVLVLTGLPLVGRYSVQSMNLGDSVYKWVEEAQRTSKAEFVFWRVAEPKRC